MPFGGIKVLELPVKVISAVDAATQQSQELFRATYGMACAGSLLTAFLVKELVAEVLNHLQFLGGANEIEFDRICRVVAKFHAHLHSQISRDLEYSHDLDFLFGGLCPITGRVRVARFWTGEDPPRTQWAETLLGTGPADVDAVGLPRACHRFHELLQPDVDAPPCRVPFAVYRRLLDIIKDPDFPGVAGAIQSGDFDADGQFTLHGSLQHEIQDDHITAKTYVRGTDVESVYQPEDPRDFFVTYSFLDPSREDIQGYQVRSYITDEGERRLLDETITLWPYDARWPAQFGEESAFLEQILGQKACGIEHIGSTAVEGMTAIPVIDIMVGIPNLENPRIAPFDLTIRGFEFLGDADLPGRLLYRKRGGISFNLHVVEHLGGFWDQAIRLRAFLRGNPHEARQFGLHKARILNLGSWTRLRYLEASAPYFHALIERATGNAHEQS
jgi:GrpB-like predicted nucleotidyltransferase (UPF0157 family)